MSDVTITVVDGQAIVQPFGASALLPFIASANAAADTAEESRDEAQVFAGLAATASNYRASISEALADFAVGEIFTTDAFGRMSAYRRVSAEPGYEFVSVSLVTDVALSATAYAEAPATTIESASTTYAGAVHLITSTAGKPVVADGVLFDTARGDLFSTMSCPTDATLTVSGASIAFANSGADKALDCMIKGADGNILHWCGDALTVDATFMLTSFPAADRTGAQVGAINNPLGLYASELKAHPGGAGRAFARLWNAGAVRQSDSAYYAFSAGAQIRVRYSYIGNQVTGTWTYPATADRTLSVTQVFTATSDEMPRMFSTLGVRFISGTMALNSLKISASYAGGMFALLGDSLFQGRAASTYANGWGSLLRADYPGEVQIFGAPSSTTADWLSNNAMQQVAAMAPRYALIGLGTNDFIGGRTLSAIEADYTALVAQVAAAGITPICLTCPPIGNANVPTFNTWLKAQGWPVIDTYAALVGSGTSLNTTYDSGDHIHWNDAGHAAIKALVVEFIAAQGLVTQATAPYLIQNALIDNAATIPTGHAVTAAIETMAGQFADSDDLAVVVSNVAALSAWQAETTETGEAVRRAASATAARGALTAAGSGSNADITRLTGLTLPMGLPGGYRGLSIISTGVSNYSSAVTAECLTLISSTMTECITLRGVSVSGAINTSGANGLDTGTLASSTWYYVWVIYNPSTSTTAALFSASATSPTLPSGYTFAARVGTVRTDGTGSKYLLPTIQRGSRVQYVVTAGSNLTAPPSVAYGAQGSPASGTYVAQSVANYVPPTAAAFRGALVPGASTSGTSMVAPSAAYGAFTGTAPGPFAALDRTATQTGPTVPFEFLLESGSIYFASTNNDRLICTGWTENL